MASVSNPRALRSGSRPLLPHLPASVILRDMMTSIRAHFDGKVFVPDEPVLLPPDAAVRLLVAPDADGDRPLLELARLAAQFPDDPDWPADGAAEIDHYLYGTPKRNS